MGDFVVFSLRISLLRTRRARIPYLVCATVVAYNYTFPHIDAPSRVAPADAECVHMRT